MKKLLILIVVVSLSFWGCSENSSITEPTDAQSNQSFLKISDHIEVSELSIEAKSVLGVDDVNTLSKSWLPSSIAKLIGEAGGTIRFFIAEQGALAIGNLGIAADQLEDGTNVTVAMVPGEAAVDITPDKDPISAALTVCFLGVDTEDGVDFVYIDNDGSLGKVVYDRIIVGYGWAIVVNAQLGHFSRFGFTK